MMQIRKPVRTVLAILLAAVFCYSVVRLIGIWRIYSRNEAIYDQAVDRFLMTNATASTTESTGSAPSASAPPTASTMPASEPGTDVTSAPSATITEPPATTTEPPVSPDEPDFVPNWAALAAVNPDILAWIWQPGTAIHYPVLQGADNAQYLRTTYDGQSSRLGSIFLDYRSSLSARNPIIYGHNAGNGKMFASLARYRERSYWEAHPYIFLLTPDGWAKYAIFAFYETSTTGNAYTFSFADDEAYSAYLTEIQLRSAYSTGISVGVEDDILTLSTCTNTGKTRRYVVHARRVV